MEKDRELTPKEKAFDLRANMCLPQGMTGAGAKSCSIIAVNEIIKACEYNNVESWNTDWWEEVKEELKKM